MTILEKAQALARRLNAGECASDVLNDLGFSEDGDYFGEDLGSSGFGDVDDPSNNCVDLSWHGDTHYQVRRREHNRRQPFDQFPWEVETMTRTAPRVEILHMRDPDSECGLVVFLNGEQFENVSVEDIDPGRGYERHEWDERIAGARADTESSPAFREARVQALIDMGGNEFIEEDRDG